MISFKSKHTVRVSSGSGSFLGGQPGRLLTHFKKTIQIINNTFETYDKVILIVITKH